MASLTISPAIHGDNNYLYPLPGKFAIIPYALRTFIIFLTHYPTCDDLTSVSSELTVLAFPMLMVDKGIFICLLPHLYTLMKQELMD